MWRARARLVHIVHCSRFVLTLAGPYNGTGNYTPLTTANKISHIFLLVNKIQIKFTYVCVSIGRRTYYHNGWWFLLVFGRIFCASDRPMLLRVANLSILHCFHVAAGQMLTGRVLVYVCAASIIRGCWFVFSFSWRYCCHLFHRRVKIQNGRITITIKSEN